MKKFCTILVLLAVVAGFAPACEDLDDPAEVVYTPGNFDKPYGRWNYVSGTQVLDWIDIRPNGQCFISDETGLSHCTWTYNPEEQKINTSKSLVQIANITIENDICRGALFTRKYAMVERDSIYIKETPLFRDSLIDGEHVKIPNGVRIDTIAVQIQVPEWVEEPNGRIVLEYNR